MAPVANSNKIVQIPDTTAPFNPNDHLMKLSGKEYLPVAARIAWLHAEFSHEYDIRTELVEHNKFMGKNPRNVKEEITIGEAIFKARITFPNGKVVEAFGSETSIDFKDYLEKAETKALGRALGFAGYGTMMAPEFDESATLTRAESVDKTSTNTYDNTRAVDTAQDLEDMRARVAARKAAQKEKEGEATSKTTETSGTKPTPPASNPAEAEHQALTQTLMAIMTKSKSNTVLTGQINELVAEANRNGGSTRASLLPTEDLRALVEAVQALVNTHS